MAYEIKLSDRPDIKLLHALFRMRNIGLGLVIAICMTIVCAWWFPRFSSLLPYYWDGMKINTAISFICISVAITLIGHSSEAKKLVAAGVILLIPFFMVISAGLVHISGNGFGLETFFTADKTSSAPGLMSLGTMTFILIICMNLFAVIAIKNSSSSAVDLCILASSSLPLVQLAGHTFGATRVFQQSTDVYTSLQTLVCMFCIIFAVILLRPYSSLLSIPVGIGLGSQSFRIKIKYILLIPIVSAIVFFQMSRLGLFEISTAMAFATAVTTTLWLIFSMYACKQINVLEAKLRNLSFRDEMTGIYNYRAVKILGEHLIHEASSLDNNVIVYFFDLNNLKYINDKFGHDVGNELIRDFAKSLVETFSEEDLVARFGGDEFLVATIYHPGIDKIQDLDKVIQRKNNQDKLYTISYSVGHAISSKKDSFTDLIDRADEIMYQHKKSERNKLYD